MLPGYDKKGRRVFVQRLSIADPKKYTNADVLKVSLMVSDVTIENITLQTQVVASELGFTYTVLQNHTSWIWSNLVDQNYKKYAGIYLPNKKCNVLVNNYANIFLSKFLGTGIFFSWQSKNTCKLFARSMMSLGVVRQSKRAIALCVVSVPVVVAAASILLLSLLLLLMLQECYLLLIYSTVP